MLHSQAVVYTVYSKLEEEAMDSVQVNHVISLLQISMVIQQMQQEESGSHTGMQSTLAVHSLHSISRLKLQMAMLQQAKQMILNSL